MSETCNYYTCDRESEYESNDGLCFCDRHYEQKSKIEHGLKK